MKPGNTGPLIIAHRGSSAHAPENTLAAIKRALDDGAEGVEFDVRITREEIPVVFHDPDLKRIEGSEDRIEELTLNELAKVDPGRWFDQNNPEKKNTRVKESPRWRRSWNRFRIFRARYMSNLKAD